MTKLRIVHTYKDFRDGEVSRLHTEYNVMMKKWCEVRGLEFKPSGFRYSPNDVRTRTMIFLKGGDKKRAKESEVFRPEGCTLKVGDIVFFLGQPNTHYEIIEFKRMRRRLKYNVNLRRFFDSKSFRARSQSLHKVGGKE